MKLRNTPERTKRAQQQLDTNPPPQAAETKTNTSTTSALTYTKIVVGLGVLGYLGYEFWKYMQPEDQPVVNEYCFENEAIICTAPTENPNLYYSDLKCIMGFYRTISDAVENMCTPIGMQHVELTERNPQLLIQASAPMRLPIDYLRTLARGGNDVFLPSVQRCRSDVTNSLFKLKLN